MCFAWIVGLPGDEIGVSQGGTLVNGKPDSHGDHLDLPDLAGMRIPAHHLWLVSDHHYSDSYALGADPGDRDLRAPGAHAMNELLRTHRLPRTSGFILLAITAPAWRCSRA